MTTAARAFRESLLAARVAARYREAAASWIDGLDEKFGVLTRFMQRDNWVIYLSPGPMKSTGNYEYVLVVGGDDRLHLPTAAEIAQHERGMRDLAKGIADGRVGWWMPASNAYHFGIQLTDAGMGKVTVEYIGRPNNAQGYSLDLGRRVIHVSDVPALLTGFAHTGAIRQFLKKFDGSVPAYNR